MNPLPDSLLNPRQTQQLLFVLRQANMQLTTDQAFTRLFDGQSYRIRDIFARQRSGAASVACAGGIYDAATKGGNAIVAAGQSWVTLASGVTVDGVLAALNNTTLLSATPILSLTTGSTAACVADFYIYGFDVS
jgi:hypothetical protein